MEDLDYTEIAQLAGNARGTDTSGYRSDLLKLVRLAESLQGQR
ncbi:MAG: hypothetical protein ABW074_13160 [Sedimenticola sp.]